jgi:poly(A) polymerase Pap1
VKDLSAAASAHVPIMSFNMDGVDFDVLFAQLPLTSVKVRAHSINIRKMGLLGGTHSKGGLR